MQTKLSIHWSLFIISVVGILCSSAIIFFPPLDLSAQSSSLTPTAPTNSQAPKNVVTIVSVEPHQAITVPKAANTRRAIRLKIPKINVDAAVGPVGLTLEGAMDAPKGPTDVAWFERGPRPGEKGSAVITGHYGRWENGTKSVFDNLNRLKPGDTLSIEDAQGVTISFVVRELRLYNQNDDAADVFGSSDGKAHLNLIACAGVWDKVKKIYPDRLVVFTDKEEIE